MKAEYKAIGSFGTLGLEIVACLLFGYFGGRWIDGELGSGPWLSVVGFLFGCGAAGKAIHRSLREMREVTAREEQEQGNPAPLYELPSERDRERERDRGSPAQGDVLRASSEENERPS